MKRLRDDGSSSRSASLSGDSTDTVGVISKVKELFEGHANLISGFNTFLQKGYGITLEDEFSKKITLEDDEAAPPKKQPSGSLPGDLVGTLGVMIRVKELFEGHNNLISGFNIFVPKAYEMALDNDDALPQEKIVKCQEAISFVNMIKILFQNGEHVYKSFLDIWNKYWNEHKDIVEVYNKISSLFNGHPDLLDEFRRFLLEAAYLSAAEHVGL